MIRSVPRIILEMENKIMNALIVRHYFLSFILFSGPTFVGNFINEQSLLSLCQSLSLSHTHKSNKICSLTLRPTDSDPI